MRFSLKDYGRGDQSERRTDALAHCKPITSMDNKLLTIKNKTDNKLLL